MWQLSKVFILEIQGNMWGWVGIKLFGRESKADFAVVKLRSNKNWFFSVKLQFS